MYTKPQLQQFGSFRELTLIGFDRDGDGGILGNDATDGCNILPYGDCNRS